MNLTSTSFDVTADRARDTSFTLATHNSLALVKGQLAVALDANGDVMGLRCRSIGGDSCEVELLVDSDGDDALSDETGVVIEILGSLSS